MRWSLSERARETIRASVAILALAAGLLIIFNFQYLLLIWAIIFSEKRPSLLRDADWNDPASAVLFEERFRTGVAEEELLEWLKDNRFAVRPQTRRAERRIDGLPCNEAAEVTWAIDGQGDLTDAEATLTEQGCL